MSFKDKFIEFQNLAVNDTIRLRQVNVEKDLQDYYQIYNDTALFQYYEGGPKEKVPYEGVRRILENQIRAFEKQREYIWTITVRSEDRAIGRIHFSDFDCNNKIANIGYFLSRDCWGKGIISACIDPVVRFGFSYLGLERIYTTVHTDNHGSWRALEKNGFTREGHLRHCFNLHTGLCDCYLYAKLATDGCETK